MKKNRSSITSGIIMIAVGLLFLLLNMFPGISAQINFGLHWPLLIVLVGLFFLFSAPLSTGDMAIPGSIVIGIGTILYYQNLTGNWASWAYIWTLIPGFVGIGLVLSSLKEDQTKKRQSGFKLIGLSALLFIIFGLFFTGFGRLGALWPLGLIGLGIWLLFRNHLKR